MKPLQIHWEIMEALREIERLQPRRVLEIGTARGGTFFLLARAAHPEATLISLDLPGGLYGGGYSSWKTSVFQRSTLPLQKSYFVRSDSHSRETRDHVEKILHGEPLDVLFIDGDHTYEGVRTDFEMYSPLVRHGGLIVLHDVARHPPEKVCHVDIFWEELRQKFETRTIVANEGQGWAGIGIVFP